MNLEDASIEVRTEPDPASGAYRKERVVRRGETLAAAAVPAVQVDVAALFL